MADNLEKLHKRYTNYAIDMIVKLNGVDPMVVRKKIYDPEKLGAALRKSKSVIWTDESVAPTSREFKVRFTTYLVSWVARNFEKILEAPKMYTDVDDDDMKSNEQYADYIYGHLIDMANACINKKANFNADAYYFALLSILLNDRIPKKKKEERVEVVSQSIVGLKVYLSKASPETSLETMVRVAYMLCTNAKNCPHVTMDLSGYEWKYKASTQSTLETLGQYIYASASVYGLDPIFQAYLMSDPKVTSNYPRVKYDENVDLMMGSLAFSYMKLLFNDSNLGKMLYDLK